MLDGKPLSADSPTALADALQRRILELDQLTSCGMLWRMPSDLTGFIARLPKAELHVHHVGSASPRIVSELATRHPGAVPSDPEALAEFFAFRDFAHFIEVYLAVVDLIRTPEDVRLLTYEIAREMAEVQQVRYAELTCTPHTSVLTGIPIEAFTEAIEDARVAAEREFGIVLRWIYDIPGELGVPGADATLGYALDHAPESLIGFGLGGPEIGVPRPQFEPHFAAARAAGLRSIPHAGETTGSARRCGTRSATSAPNGSATARRRPRTRRCWPTSPSTGSRSRCARRPTSRPGPWPRSRSTRCGRSSTPASWSRSTATTRRCSGPR